MLYLLAVPRINIYMLGSDYFEKVVCCNVIFTKSLKEADKNMYTCCTPLYPRPPLYRWS